MHAIFKNILAFIVGIIVGGAVNMGIIMVGSSIIPPPAGVDLMDVEALKANMHLFEPQHFIIPFLAHAIGTLLGALLTATIAATYQTKLALGIGLFFLAGGIANLIMLPAPIWFAIVDIVGAYLPMGWLGSRIASSWIG
ncbi:hypothetical protein [Fodinibius saliphilus]|uniref:hypothetical protein n=1 Tax=Fodinibius saliphilus TaxID=1920650 RepID=UPI0011087A55|nr:hypothetical protein [Fodinibius saliphilus]